MENNNLKSLPLRSKCLLTPKLLTLNLGLAAIIGLGACNNNNGMNEQTSTDSTQMVNVAPQAPEWSKNATIYELNIRQYTPEGTFKAIMPHVERIKNMGISIVWFMPIQPIGELNRKGSMGSYYAVKDYTAINPEFGTMDEFKALVKAFQDAGIKVIIDWVANHSAPDNVWVSEHKDWYNLDSAGNVQPPKDTDWYDVADLNYDNKALWAAMQDAMAFWVKETNIDGFRCDVAFMVPTEFWNETRAKLDSIKPMFMLAEGESTELHERAFDMTYAWEYMHLANEVAQGKKSIQEIKHYMAKQDSLYQEADYRMYFSTNHDENSWNGTAAERYGKNEQVMHVLNFTLSGMPLLYSGQENGENKRLLFFEKDPIEWGNYSQADFFTKLLTLNRNNQALWNGTYGAKTVFLDTEMPEKVLAYYRFKNNHNVLVVLNFSDDEVNVTLNNNSEGSLEAQELFTGEKVVLANPFTVKLNPHSYKVYSSIP